MFTSLLFALSFSFAAPDDVVWVKDKQPTAVIVLPEAPFPIAKHAAKELVYHIHKATGATLETHSEPYIPQGDYAVIYIGATLAARNAGLDPAALTREATRLFTKGNDTYIVGNDGPGDPLSIGNSHAGTLWGVYEILERYLGVRWLWPGELGEHIPAAKDVRIPPLDETFGPAFNMRRLRPGLGLRGFTEGNQHLGFSDENRKRYAADQNLFLRRHRLGQAEDCFYAQKSAGSGHSFEGWWDEYGAEHPDWFALLPNGKRGPENPAKPRKFTMCVSSEGLQDEIVRRWKEERDKSPGEQLNIGVGENDDSAQCVCEKCKEWDGPQPDVSKLPPGLERSYEPMQASNRYARFLKAVYDKAAVTDPNVRVHMYAYVNYFWAPDPSIKLNSNIVIGFVPWFRWAGWFPRTEAEHAWIKEQWMGWKRSGVTLYYRPNWTLDGYTMPLVYMHQFADAFQFYAKNGMTGTDFDSLQGQWAAQGPNLYLLTRIHTRPERHVEDLLDEYYTAFGPAKAEVKAYFDYWEQYAIKNSPRAADAIRSRRDGYFRRYALYAQVADELYPLDVFAPAKAILDRAAQSAANDSLARDRVAFLRDGLRHAEACVEMASVVNNPASTRGEKKAAIAKLVEIRKSLEHTNIANMDRAAIIETDSWKEIEGLFEE